MLGKFLALRGLIGNTGGGNTGGGNSNEDWIGDGKTHLWIKIAAEGRMDVPLYFQQTVANGVTIDWGDGSAMETLSGTGNVNTTHAYAKIGEYVISLDVADGCTLGLGHNSVSYCVMGSASNNANRVYCNMLQKVEIANGFTRIGDYTFQKCYSLESIVIPEGVTSIGSSVFGNCGSLASIVIPEGVTSIGNGAFNNCTTLASIVIPESVTSIGSSVFGYCSSIASIVIPESVTSIATITFTSCYGVKFYDFTKHTVVPVLNRTDAFNGIPSDCEIRVPAALYDEWIAATNWTTYASQIVAV